MKKLIKSKLFLQVIVASFVATLATVGIVAATSTIGADITTTGNLAFATASSTGAVQLASITSTAAGISFTNKNLTSVGDIAFATASSTGAMKVASLGIASTTPAAGFQLSIGSGAAASSTVSMGKFCLYGVDPAGRAMYITLATSGNTVFATSTTPCNQ